MRTTHGPRFRFLLAAAAGAALLGAAILPSAAGADVGRAESASLTMSSDPGDYIGQGQQYSYSTDANDVFSASDGGNGAHISVNAANGDWWYLDFAAPAGQQLAPGTYSDAIRYPFQSEGPGLSVSGNGRGCNTLTGSFTVTEITFGPFQYLQSFAASFEQHCEGATSALRGTVHVVNPPAPEPLQIESFDLSSTGTASRITGAATVSGTVTCNQPTSLSVLGTLSQRVNRSSVATGSFYSEVACTTTPTRWQATITPGNGIPFNPGSAQLDATASAYDQQYGQQVTMTETAVVKLTR